MENCNSKQNGWIVSLILDVKVIYVLVLNVVNC